MKDGTVVQVTDYLRTMSGEKYGAVSFFDLGGPIPHGAVAGIVDTTDLHRPSRRARK